MKESIDIIFHLIVTVTLGYTSTILFTSPDFFNSTTIHSITIFSLIYSFFTFKSLSINNKDDTS